MEKTTRGYLESTIDNLIEKTLLIPSIDWIRQEIPISSFENLALGYAIGTLETLAGACVRISSQKLPTEADNRTIRNMLKRRLPEIVEKIEKELHR